MTRNAALYYLNDVDYSLIKSEIEFDPTHTNYHLTSQSFRKIIIQIFK